MLPVTQQTLFLVFAAVTGAFGIRGFVRLYRRIARGRADTDARWNNLPRRLGYALVTTLTQSRTFRTRRVIGIFHSFIFYGFSFYLLVNLVDAVDGFVALPFASLGIAGNLYVLAADVLSALVLVGVLALVVRRFLLPSRRDFRFNQRTLLHRDVKQRYVTVDSVLVSIFILFHVGSRALGAGAKLAIEGPDRFAPFATLVSHLFTPEHALAWRIFGYWGALGSVLAFLSYFPYSKHLHLFMAPFKYVVKRDVASGVLPALDMNLDADLDADPDADRGSDPETKAPQLGAARLEELAWPRLVDAYACIQCNRCQDVCPATQTGKSLSPSALEINKRMELNDLARHQPSFEQGAASPHPLLSFALSPEAAWACTTCGACIDVCPVGDEPMLDIIDIRRERVMIAGEFPAQLQTAFRGMERAQNPWGINHEKRMDWADGLNVRTTDDNPAPDVLYWVGCAASYDPQSQKTARAFVQLLDYAGVDFAVLGKRECCTGDTARRAGNEHLYRQLADKNVATLNEVRPKLIVATCPHCMNTVGKEYAQLGGDYKVMHHTEYLETLVAAGRLEASASPATVTYHDPCYLGRHNGVYDAPRNVLNILSNGVVELPRNRENSFCCGAGGAQFWKEEEAGEERVSDNRYREVQDRLAGAEEKVLAVGCPFCKSMLESTPGRGADPIAVKDVAELLLDGVLKKKGVVLAAGAGDVSPQVAVEKLPVEELPLTTVVAEPAAAARVPLPSKPEKKPGEVLSAPRKAWTPKQATAPSDTGTASAVEPAGPGVTPEIAGEPVAAEPVAAEPVAAEPVAAASVRKAWKPKQASAGAPLAEAEAGAISSEPVAAVPEPMAAVRKPWKPKKTAAPGESGDGESGDSETGAS